MRLFCMSAWQKCLVSSLCEILQKDTPQECNPLFPLELHFEEQNTTKTMHKKDKTRLYLMNPYHDHSCKLQVNPCRLILYLDRLQYDKDHVFLDAQLATLTPTNIARWMRFWAYGTAEPGPNVNPTHAKLNILKTWEKQISHFMPNKLMKWDAMLNVGNTTKSIEVNDVI